MLANDAHIAQRAVMEPLSQAIEVLRGARGFFAASPLVERHAWRAFVSSLSIAQRYPGLQSLAYVAVVKRNEAEHFLAQTRSDGAPDFAFQSDAERDERYVIKFNEPQDLYSSTLGIDISLDEQARIALQRSAQIGLA